MNKLEKSVIKTIVFYNLLKRPLRLDEIWLNLFQIKAGKLQVLMALKKLISKEVIEEKDNLYFLKNEKKIFSDYLLNQKHNKIYRSKAGWVLKILKFTPFLKNISVINSLSYNGVNENSDIDILIIAKKKRFWTTRALVVLFLEIIGQNKNKWYKAGKFCLGFGFDETKLDLVKIKYQKDIDFTYWLANLTPVYDRGIYKNLIAANSWLNMELPNWEEKKVKSKREKVKIIEKLLLGKFGDKVENWLAKIQINRILNDSENHRKGASVIADKSMMKLHAYDTRKQRQNDFEILTRKLFGIK